MSMLQQRVAWMLAGVLILVGLWACSATRTADGTITITFSPDMTITARGLEDALDQLTDLLDECITGNFHRPCTPTEMDEINKALGKVVDRKARMGEPPVPTGVC